MVIIIIPRAKIPIAEAMANPFLTSPESVSPRVAPRKAERENIIIPKCRNNVEIVATVVNIAIMKSASCGV